MKKQSPVLPQDSKPLEKLNARSRRDIKEWMRAERAGRGKRVFPMKDKHWLGMIGVVMCSLAWVAVNADHFPFVYKIITPEFYNARVAYDKLRQRDAILGKGDQGFPEISSTLKTLMGRDLSREITQVKSIGSGFGGPAQLAGSRSVCHLSLEITFLKFPKEIWQFGGLDEAIRERYLSLNFFLWGSIVFATGLMLSLIAVFMRE
jgi:hypothetical protein